MQIELITIGSSVGIILPKEILSKLNVMKGDNLYVIPTKSGIELTPCDMEFAEQMQSANEIMEENKDVLSMLAK